MVVGSSTSLSSDTATRLRGKKTYHVLDHIKGGTTRTIPIG